LLEGGFGTGWIILIGLLILLVTFLIVGLAKDESKKAPPKGGARSICDVTRPRDVDVNADGGILRIDRLDFLGQCSHSPDGRYTVGWSESSGGEKGAGKFVLLQGSRILLTGRMKTPNDGAVSNKGTFVLSDWGSPLILSGTFYAISLSGETIVKRKFRANLFNSGIADDGSVAVCQTCNSTYEPDSGKLVVFDLATGLELGRFEPPFGYADAYVFEGEFLHIVYDSEHSYRFRFDGTCVDKNKLEKDRPFLGYGYDLFSLAEDRLRGIEGANLAAYEGVIELLRGVLQKNVSDRTQARTHRRLGEIYHRCGEKALALDHFESALKLDPKIGVKKVYENLKRSQ